MKAIKLASVFAVSAVAAAVSSTTFAEAVFTGTAGLEYQVNDSGSDQSKSRGEVNVIGDTGLVYFKLDMEDNTKKSDGSAADDNGDFNLDAIYVRQGAVSFGDFDGSLIDSAAFSAGVEEDNDDAKYSLDNDLGIRYAVSDDLTVALENVEGDNHSSLAFSYSKDLGGLTLGLSGGYQFNSDIDNKLLTLGIKVPAGIATFTAFYEAGKQDDLDAKNMGVGIDLGITKALSVAVQYYNEDGEASKGVDLEDKGITEATVYFTEGDVTYYVSYLDYDAEDADYGVMGAKVSF